MLEVSSDVETNGIPIDALATQYDTKEIEVSCSDRMPRILIATQKVAGLTIFWFLQTANDLLHWPAASHMLALVLNDQM